MLLELQNLGKSFGEHEVLRDVNAGVERGDRIGIIGANGTGKTTLLRILCGESLPDAGDAAFGTGVTTGYLEQNARLDPSLDIYATMRLVFTPALDAMQEMDALGYSGAYMMELYRQNYDEFTRLRESVDRLQDIADSLGIR